MFISQQKYRHTFTSVNYFTDEIKNMQTKWNEHAKMLLLSSGSRDFSQSLFFSLSLSCMPKIFHLFFFLCLCVYVSILNKLLKLKFSTIQQQSFKLKLYEMWNTRPLSIKCLPFYFLFGVDLDFKCSETNIYLTQIYWIFNIIPLFFLSLALTMYKHFTSAPPKNCSRECRTLPSL